MDLSGIPKSERELYGINQEQIRRLEQRQKDILILKEDLPKTDKIGRGRLQKEHGKINRWLGDLRQAPETFVNVNMEGLSDKKFGEAIHTHTRRVMDRFRLDTRPSKKGGSSIHHKDSTMQTLGAVETASTGMRRDLIEAVKDQGDELATGLRGLNFFDVSEETHPLYHPGEGGKVDYKNLLAKARLLPSDATLKERLTELNRSRAVSTAASVAADNSPQATQRKTDLIETIKLGGGGEILDAQGNQFDPAIRTPEGIAALRKPLKAGLKMLNGSYRMSFFGLDQIANNIVKNPMAAIAGAAGYLDPSAITSALQGKYREAVIQTGFGAAAGSGISQGLKSITSLDKARALSTVNRVAPRVVNGAIRMGVPQAIGRAGPYALATYTGLELIDAAAKGITGKGMFEPSGRPVTEEDLQFSTL